MNRFRSALFKIESGEAPAVVLNFVQSMLIGLPRLFTLTVGGAVFVDRYSADNIPFAFIAATVLLPIIGNLQLALARRLSFVAMQIVLLVFSTSVLLGFLLLLNISSARWPAFALFVWFAAEFQLGNFVLWNTANRVFTVRQGKRLFGLIGSGEIVTAILGGALTPFLVREWGTVNLLSLSMIGFLLTLVNFGLIVRFCRDQMEVGGRGVVRGNERRHEPLAAMLRNRYLVFIFSSYALYTVASYFFNNIFFVELDRVFVNSAEVAAFLGQFFAAYSVLSLLFRSFLSGRILIRFGLVAGMLATPVFVFAGYVVVILSGSGYAMMTVVFWAVVVTRLFEKLFWGSIGQPSYYTLYQPLSRERRVQVQATSETILAPLAGGVTGVLLLFLNKVLLLGAVGLAACVLPLLFVWILVCIAATREYRDALTEALQRRGIAGGDLEVGDPTSLKILERGLDSARPREVLYCLRLLHSAGHPAFLKLLLGLVDHPSATVRTGVYEIARRDYAVEALPILMKRLDEEKTQAPLGALLCAIGAGGGEQAAAVVGVYAQDPDPEIRRGALIAMLRDCGSQAKVQAERALKALSGSDARADRTLACAIIAELEAGEADDLLAQLMEDDDIDVRRAALGALAAIGRPDIWRLAIGNLEVPELRVDALQAFIKNADLAFRALVEAYNSASTPRGIRRLIVQILGRFGSPEAATVLRKEIGTGDGGLLLDILWSLHLCGFRATGEGVGDVENCLSREIAFGEELVVAVRNIRRSAGVELLRDALEHELATSRRRIFLLLSFLYDSDALLKIASNFMGAPAQRDLALELFESKVAKRHAQAALPMLTDRVPGARQSPEEAMLSLLRSEIGGTVSTWTQSCIVECLRLTPEQLSRDEWARLRSSQDIVLAETSGFNSPGHENRKSQMAILDRVRILNGVSIFREIDGEMLAELAQRLEEVDLRPGEMAFREGELGRSMFIVTAGRLRLHCGDHLISDLGPGEIFGELSALQAEARTESATALENCHLFRLSDNDLHVFMAARIEVVRGIVEVLCHRVRNAPVGNLEKEEERAVGETSAPARVNLYGADFLSNLEKVLTLKTADMFAEVSDDILTEVAGRTQELRLRAGEQLFRKGDPGTTTYIVAAGRIRIHIGEQWIADAGERAVVGELAALSSEPRTASVTAAEDSLLLALDQDSLFELMWDQHEIVRGIFRVLIGRLRRLRHAG